jgi:membrane fusion protein, multidrug efflux system
VSRIRRSHRRLWFGIVAISIVGAGAALWLTRGEDGEALAADAETQAEEGAAEEIPAVPVEIRDVQVADLPNYYRATGNLRARRSVDLIAKVTGQITKIDFEEGDQVEAGAPLLEIDSREQNLKVKESAARVETAETQLSRMSDMSERGLETDRAYEEAAQAFQVNQAQYEMEQLRLEDHYLRAPFAGTITLRSIELGQTVQTGASMVSIADMSILEVQLHLPESAVARLEVGQPVEVHADASGPGILNGRVLRISPAVDAATSTVKVTLSVANPDSKVRTGSFVRAKITTDVHSAVVCVPRKALVAEAGADFVFVAEADTVRKVSVETGYADEEQIEIVEGLEPGHRVVVVGQGGLRTGSRVVEVTEDGRAKNEPSASTELAQSK